MEPRRNGDACKDNGSYMSIKRNYASTIQVALEHQRKGELIKAEAHYNQILSQNPHDPDALHLLGVLHQLTGRIANSISLINRAIRLCPTNPNFYNSLGTSMKRDADFKKAKQCYEKALNLNANHPEALYNLAGIYYAISNYGTALLYYQRAVEVKRDFPEAMNNMAATLNMLGQYQTAIDWCNLAIKISPKYSEAYNNMGNSFLSLGKLESAIRCYENAISLAGENAEILCNLANAFQEIGEAEKAIVSYKKAIEINPTYGKAYNNLGTAYRSKRSLGKAEEQFKIAIKLSPEDVEAYHNIGNIYYDRGDYNTAIVWYRKAISIQPDKTQTLVNLGIACNEIGQSEKALAYYEKALQTDANDSKTICHLVHEYYKRCEWAKLDGLNSKLDRLTKKELDRGARPNEMPFLSVIRSDNLKLNLLIAKRWSDEISRWVAGNRSACQFIHTPSKHDKLTIGYLSNNFRNHPTSHLIHDIFDLHDRSRFAIYAYSYGEDDGSLQRKKIKRKSDVFIDSREYSHEEFARRIYDDRVDILVDLVGYMQGNRLEVCAYRPAPVQVRWLGFAGTTGANFYDYIVTDRIATPTCSAPYFTEKFIFMPHSYQVNSKPIELPTTDFNRQSLGLPEHGFVYCCFCSSYKINSDVFDSWLRILKRVDGSVLWVLESNPAVASNLQQRAELNKLDPERLIFAKKANKYEHLERIKLADLALDTRNVNGAATTSDALWAGVPVVTKIGNHFASRMSASILSSIGLPELITDSVAQYEDLSVAMAFEPKALFKLRSKLKANKTTQPLFDTQRFVSSLENAYEQIWALRLGEKTPRAISAVDFSGVPVREA